MNRISIKDIVSLAPRARKLYSFGDKPDQVAIRKYGLFQWYEWEGNGYAWKGTSKTTPKRRGGWR